MKLHEEVIDAIRSRIRPFSEMNALVYSLKDARVVMLGEATHGTAEFYDLRAEITLQLIRNHGFGLVAVEGDWPDASRLRRYVLGLNDRPVASAHSALTQIHRWPLWMWANEETMRFAEMLKTFRTPFYGLDVYSLYESIDEVLKYLERVNPLMARRFSERYSCFERFKHDEISYAKALLSEPLGCEAEAIENLKDLLRLRTSSDDSEALFDAQQNARVIRNAESYYRSMLRGDTTSWNSRDHHMLETLSLILEREGPNAKAIVWAHNTHIGDYRATDMWGDGYVNLGGLARQRFGSEKVRLVGFTSYEGNVMAARAWGAQQEVMSLPPAKPGSYEECFHLAGTREGIRDCLLSFDSSAREGPLSQVLGQRAVGVVYQPEHERRGQYVPTSLAERYDAFVFVDRSNAVHPLHGQVERGVFPETWPTGA